MTTEDTQRNFARRALVVSGLVVVAAFVFFVVRGELMSAVIVALLLGGGGYFEYWGRQKDLEMIEDDPEEDPFERRERMYNRKR